jgi:hypothetical protein
VTSPIDTLAALVATLLVRHTVDPVGEIDPSRDGFARRVERHVLAQLLAKYGNPNAVALATRGRKVGSTLQRNFARHASVLRVMARGVPWEVQELLDNKRGAWSALLAALDERVDSAAE